LIFSEKKKEFLLGYPAKTIARQQSETTKGKTPEVLYNKFLLFTIGSDV